MGRRLIVRGSFLAALALLLAALLLGSCSNPIDFAGEVQNEVMVAKDMYLKAQPKSPAHLATEVYPGSSLTIQFDRALDESSLNDFTIAISPPAACSYSFSKAFVLTVQPRALEANVDYTVTLTTGVRAADGSHLQNPISWSFRTADSAGGTVTIMIGDIPANEYTDDAKLSLKVTCNQLTAAVRFAETPGGFGDWEPAVFGDNLLDYTFQDATDGPKHLYTQFGDALGNPGLVTNDNEIFLDRNKPTISVTALGGAAFTGSETIALALTADDGTGSQASQMQFSNDNSNWSTLEPWNAAKPSWTLTTGDGLKTVYVRVCDASGKVSDPASDSITLDKTAPTVTYFWVNSMMSGGIATSPNVTLLLGASDGSGVGGVEMRYKTGSPPTGSWEPWAASKSWTLQDGPGTYTIYAEVRDSLGNTGQTSRSVVLYAKITVTFTKLEITDDGDTGLSGPKGEIYYTFYFAGSPVLDRPESSYISGESPFTITDGMPASKTLFVSPNSFRVNGQVCDSDSGDDDVSTYDQPHPGPYSNVAPGPHAFGGSPAGYIWYGWVVEPY